MAKKADTKSFLLRLDAATMESIEAWAAQEFRSVNGQLQWIIADALRRHRRTPRNSTPPPSPADPSAESPSS